MFKGYAAGRIARDAELRKTQGGDTVCSFTVAVDVRNGREKETVWLRCSMWGKRGESLAAYLLKGASVTVSGNLSFSEYEGKPQQNMNVDDVALQGGRQGDAPRQPSKGQEGHIPGFDPDGVETEVPF